jgi:restriction system protein
LKAELLDRLKAEAPAVFERIVIELLVKMGYGGSRVDAAQAIGKSGDEGEDGIIKEDRLGLNIIYVQAKRWAATVGPTGNSKVRWRFARAARNQRDFHYNVGFFERCGRICREDRQQDRVIDGSRLAELMIEFGVAVATDAMYTVERIDNDFFESI